MTHEVLIRRGFPVPKYHTTRNIRAANVTARNIHNTPSPAEGVEAASRGIIAKNPVYDVTQAYSLGEKVLDRFSMGTPTASVELPLEFAYLEIGDVIELERAPIAWEGYDQYAQLKWEVTSVEYNPLGDSPALNLTLCIADHTKPVGWSDFSTKILPDLEYISPSSDDGGSRPYRPRPPNPFGFDSHMRRNAGIIGGCGPTIKTITGQTFPNVIEIGPGTISNGNIGVPVEAPLMMQSADSDGFPVGPNPIRGFGNKLKISRDNLSPDYQYKVYALVEGVGFDVLAVPKSASTAVFKDLGLDNAAPLFSFTTDASGDPETLSLIDLRDLGTVYKKENLPASLGGANLDYFFTIPDQGGAAIQTNCLAYSNHRYIESHRNTDWRAILRR